MALSYKSRRWLSVLVLVVALPIYVIVASKAVDFLGRPHVLIELIVYAVLGVIWAFPLKGLFKGIGQADPDE